MLPTPRVVLDTNTALALWWFADPQLAPLQQAIVAHVLEPIVSPRLADEWSATLERLAAPLTPNERFARLTAARTAFVQAVTLLPHPDEAWRQQMALPRCRDAEDQKILECAVAHRAQWLLTRDKALLRLRRHAQLRERVAIMTPEAWQETVLPCVASPLPCPPSPFVGS